MRRAWHGQVWQTGAPRRRAGERSGDVVFCIVRFSLFALAIVTVEPTQAGDILFADRALSSVRAQHPEFDRNPLTVMCHAPSGHITQFSEGPRVDGVTPRQPVVVRRVDDARCDAPFHWAVGALAPIVRAQ